MIFALSNVFVYRFDYMYMYMYMNSGTRTLQNKDTTAIRTHSQVSKVATCIMHACKSMKYTMYMYM